MIDKSAFRDLSYGLYIVSSMKDGRAVGCVVNTFAQVTSDPPQVSIATTRITTPPRASLKQASSK